MFHDDLSLIITNLAGSQRKIYGHKLSKPPWMSNVSNSQLGVFVKGKAKNQSKTTD